jgi:hypothetical protein
MEAESLLGGAGSSASIEQVVRMFAALMHVTDSKPQPRPAHQNKS